MPKFDIYMIWSKACDGNILRYYGSTQNFIKRKYNHKKTYEHWVKQGRPNNKKCSSFFILDNGDWKMDKIDEIDGECWEARKLESEYQKNNECVNVRIECRTNKEYCQDNKNKVAVFRKNYYNKHKEELLEKNKENYNLNKDKISEISKKKYNLNKDKILEKCKQYRILNKDKISEKKKENYNLNKDKILKKNKEKYNLNKDKILEKQKEKITCECGAEVTKKYIAVHRRSKKHINLLNSN